MSPYSGGSVLRSSSSPSISILPASISLRSARSLEVMRDEEGCVRPDDEFETDAPATMEVLSVFREVMSEVTSVETV